ncbi:hypothetical protein [Porphyromonas sp.]|uniref:hypothetical protein n=1 Tax=Porphyromonas sp. TaxID=1924944 RepID=UPI0026DCEDBC|nr:hypothetical protein [Porphyromonas sp.]MDO4771287.1 hypothetical protein [Porphyromonas sp.]
MAIKPSKTRPARRQVSVKKERRDCPLAMMLTPSEHELIQHFVKKHKISNKSDYFRRLILTEVFNKLNINYPTIFEEDELFGK